MLDVLRFTPFLFFQNYRTTNQGLRGKQIALDLTQKVLALKITILLPPSRISPQLHRQSSIKDHKVL